MSAGTRMSDMSKRKEDIFNWIYEFRSKNARDPKGKEINEAFNFKQGNNYLEKLKRRERRMIIEKNEKKNGGKLFGSGEMTLRDWFAGQALVSLVRGMFYEDSTNGCTNEKDVAKRAYMIADAMLEEKTKEAASA